jgi:hydrogenase-1 operon protein HyaE
MCLDSAIHPLIVRLQERCGWALLHEHDAIEFASQPGATLLFFTEDPLRYRETLDVAVILPELVAASAASLRVGVLLPAASRAQAARWGVKRWPALVALRDGAYLGAIEGLLDWAAFRQAFAELLAAPAARAPGIGIAVNAIGGTATCH